MAHGKRRKDSIHETPDVSYITNPDVAHEHTDVSISPLLKFVVGLAVFTIVTCLAMWLLFRFFESRARADELRASPLARRGAERLPPEPRLQLAPGFGVDIPSGEGQQRRVELSYDPEGRTDRSPQPQSEWWTLQDVWRHELENYGWESREAQTVRLPIRQAMEMYARQQQQQQQGAGGVGGGQQPGATQQPAQQQQGGGARPATSEQIPSPAGSGTANEARRP
jgi:hypothetical protein